MEETVNLKIELSLDEVNGVLVALSKLPYDQVADLIVKIRTQAMPQVSPNKAESK